MKVNFYESNRKDKRMKAVFSDTDFIEIVHFGQRGASTYIDHNDHQKKRGYISRHKVRENWNDPFTPGALSRYILWNKPTLEESIKNFKDMFKLE